jgi:hypothetical protein
MIQSVFQTIQTPATGTPNAATLAKAGPAPLRVYVSNVGAAVVALSFASENLANITATTSCFRLLANRDITAVLAPGQTIFGASLGAPGLVSVAVSEALPVETTVLRSSSD